MLKYVPVVVFFQEGPTTPSKAKRVQAKQNSEETFDLNLKKNLHQGARNNDVTVLKQLEAQGVRFNNRNDNLYQVLQTAAFAGSTKFFEKLIRLTEPNELENLLNRPNQYGATLLHSAAKNGHHKIIQQLLNLGADPTLRDTSKRLPLDRAIQSKDKESIRILQNAQPVSANDVFEVGSPPQKDRRMGEHSDLATRLNVIKVTKNNNSSPLNPIAKPFTPISPSHPHHKAHSQEIDNKLPSGESFDLMNDPISAVREEQAEELTWFNIFTGNRHCPFTPLDKECL